MLVRGLGFWIMSFGMSKWVINFASGCSKLMVRYGMEWFVMVCHGQVWHGILYYGLPWYGPWESLGHAYKYADSWHNNSFGTSWHVFLHTYSRHIWSWEQSKGVFFLIFYNFHSIHNIALIQKIRALSFLQFFLKFKMLPSKWHFEQDLDALWRAGDIF